MDGRRRAGRHGGPREAATPRDILERRYAAGEVSTEDYEERLPHLAPEKARQP